MLECVVNVSEGRDLRVLGQLDDAAGPDLLDRHTDPDHHRSVFTVVGEEAPRRLARLAVEVLDLRQHEGVHPRAGVVDVVPFVPLDGSTRREAREARDRFCAWAAAELGVPCFTYGEERTLPDVRRQAFAALAPTCGPDRPHPTAGAVAVGDRDVLVAYNLWLARPDPAVARRIARSLRSSSVRALGLAVGGRSQVSMNLLDPVRVGPSVVWDAVAEQAAVAGAELVGLVPEAVLRTVPASRWDQLDLAEDRTIEARLAGRTSPP